MINIRYISYSLILILIIIFFFNSNNLYKYYNYYIYKENCIISNFSNLKENKNNTDTQSSKDNLKKFCNCKIDKFKKLNVEIFISKLTVKDKFLKEEKAVNIFCKNQFLL